MDSSIAILIFIVFAVIIVVGGIYAHQQRQKRSADLLALSRRLGWRFVSDENDCYEAQFSQFGDFCLGGNRYAYNTLSGDLKIKDQPWPARMGDYHYQTTSRNKKDLTRQHHRFSYLLVQLPYLEVPDLRIRREGVFDAIAGLMGFDDINFESAEFSKRFHVKSSEKRFAYDVICPAVMEFLMANDAPPLAIEGGWCYLGNGRDTWSGEEFQLYLVWARKFFELWPTHLVASLASR